MSPHLPEAIQHILWFGLLALGLEFTAIATRLREDRTLPALGASILLLSLMVGLDIWIIIPGIVERADPAGLEAAQDLYQVLAAGYVALSLWFVRGLTGTPGPRALRAATAIFAGLALALWTDALTPARLFMYLEDYKWVTTPAYDWAFAPALIGAFAWALWLAAAGRRKAVGQDRRSLGHLCLAYAALIVCGTADFVVLWAQAEYASNFTLYGTLAMGVMATFIFTDKLIHMYRRRQGTLLEIAEIRGTLEAQRPLGELGRSATRVGDEIREYVSALKRDSQNLRREVRAAGAEGKDGERAEIRRIDEARRRLERYATGILEFSASARLGPLAPADPAALLERCVRERFPEETGRIAVLGVPGAKVPADAARLQRALGELVANALEAGSPWVEARVRRGLGLVSIAIEDAGHGCGEALGETIAQPFFTTRKQQGHHGLGASIALAIARAHGGSLRFIPKPGGGLIANLVLPAAGEAPAGARAGDGEAALASVDPARIARFRSLCANLGLRALILSPGARPDPGSRPLCVIAEADGEAPPAWRQIPFRRLDAEGRFAGDAASGVAARALCEESMLEWLAPG